MAKRMFTQIREHKRVALQSAALSHDIPPFRIRTEAEAAALIAEAILSFEVDTTRYGLHSRTGIEAIAEQRAKRFVEANVVLVNGVKIDVEWEERDEN